MNYTTVMSPVSIPCDLLDRSMSGLTDTPTKFTHRYHLPAPATLDVPCIDSQTLRHCQRTTKDLLSKIVNRNIIKIRYSCRHNVKQRGLNTTTTSTTTTTNSTTTTTTTNNNNNSPTTITTTTITTTTSCNYVEKGIRTR